MEAANSSVQKYFVDDLSDLIDVSLFFTVCRYATDLIFFSNSVHGLRIPPVPDESCDVSLVGDRAGEAVAPDADRPAGEESGRHGLEAGQAKVHRVEQHHFHDPKEVRVLSRPPR